MLTRNSQEIQNAFALTLAKNYGLSLRNLQFALERGAAQSLSLDLVLLDLNYLPKEKLAQAAEAVDYVLTAEQPAAPEHESDGHRVFSRQDSRLKVEFKDWGNLKIAYTNNISRGGLGVSLPLSSEEPAIDSVVNLALSLPDNRVLQLMGRICYCRDGEEHRHIGIQLHHQHASELLQIDELLRAQPE